MSADAVYCGSPSADLQEGWRWTSIESLISEEGTFCDGDWVESKDQDPDGDVRLIQLADVGVAVFRDRSDRSLTLVRASELKCTFLCAGDILVARMPDPLGRACIFPGSQRPCVTVVDVAIVRPKNSDVDGRWLMHRINGKDFREAVASLQSGSTRLRISRKNLARIHFLLPPLDEQRRIVAEIEKQFSRLDEAVANLQRVKANLKRYKAAILKAAVEGRLVETEASLAHREGRSYETGEQLLQRILEARRTQWTGRGKYKEPELLPVASRIELPTGWVWSTLEQLHLQIADVDHKMPKAQADGIPYISTKDFFGDEGINFTGAKRISAQDYEALCRKVKPESGDVLLSRYGTVGEVRVVTVDSPFQVSYSAAILKPVRKLVPIRFLTAALRSEVVVAQIKRDVRATAQPDLGLAHIRQFVVPVPPMNEQLRIVEELDRCLSVVREVEAEVDINLQRAQALRQTTLAKSFSGEGHGVPD